MLFNLSLKNFRKSIRDYSIYFFTLILGVAVFYIFNSIETQSAMLDTEHQDNMASDHGTLDTMSFTHSLLTGQQQVLAKLMPDDPRIRRAEELQQNFLKILIGRFSLREEILATDRAKIFPFNPIHCVFPASHYFVFTLKRILI